MLHALDEGDIYGLESCAGRLNATSFRGGRDTRISLSHLKKEGEACEKQVRHSQEAYTYHGPMEVVILFCWQIKPILFHSSPGVPDLLPR